jgi:hypothetical protein
MFGNAMHGRIFAAIMTLRAGGRLANPLTLPDVLRDDPGLAGSITTMGNAVFRYEEASGPGFPLRSPTRPAVS